LNSFAALQHAALGGGACATYASTCACVIAGAAPAGSGAALAAPPGAAAPATLTPMEVK
jgi:hypothetical protein